MESIRELRKKVAKSGKSHHAPTHDIVVRRISIYLTWLLLHTRISANGVTLMQILVGVAGGLLLIASSHPVNFLGILLLQLGYVLDCSDGEVARYRNQSSVRGIFLDLIGHEIVIPMMYMGLALGEFQRMGRMEVLLLGFTTALFSLRFDVSAMFQVVNTLFIKADNPSYAFEKLEKIEPTRLTKQAVEKPSIFRVMFRYPESMNILTIIILMDWLAGWQPLGRSLIYYFLLTYGILIPAARIYSIYKIYNSGEIEAKYLELIAIIKKQLSRKS